MNIAVPIKYVPDTETIVRIGADRKSINPDGITFVLNPYDEFALEESLKIREASGGEVTLVTIGSDSAVKALRTGMAMGADKAIHVKCDDQIDPSAAAKILAGVLQDKGFDIIFTGMKAVDDDAGVVGPMLAEFLGLPCITMVTKLEVEGGKAFGYRESEAGAEKVEASLPAVFTAQKGLNEPRYASLKGIMMAKKKPVETVEPGDYSNGLNVVEMKLPPSRAAGIIVGEGAEAVPELVRLLKEEAKVL